MASLRSSGPRGAATPPMISEVQIKNQLQELMSLPENKTCMDCGGRDPRWVSTTIGVFLCIKCAGAHRSMDSGISSVKSIDLDKWTLDQIEKLRNLGNAKAKLYFEANLPPSEDWKTTRQIGNESENIALAKFLRRKYEYREFAADKKAPGRRPATSKTERTTSSSPKQMSQSPVLTPPLKGFPPLSLSSSGNHDPLIRFDDSAPNDLLKEEKAQVTKNDIMMMYHVMTPTSSLSKSIPPQVAIPSPTIRAPNYNVFIENNGSVYHTPYGYSPYPQYALHNPYGVATSGSPVSPPLSPVLYSVSPPFSPFPPLSPPFHAPSPLGPPNTFSPSTQNPNTNFFQTQFNVKEWGQ